jgi:hypothetical protein
MPSRERNHDYFCDGAVRKQAPIAEHHNLKQVVRESLTTRYENVDQSCAGISLEAG